MPTRISKVSEVQILCVCTKTHLQQVLNHDGETKRHENRRKLSRIDRAIQQPTLKEVSKDQRYGNNGHERPQRITTKVVHQHDSEVRSQYTKVAVSQVHNAHDTEHQGEPAGKQRVQASQQYPLDNGVGPYHFVSAFDSDPGRPLPK